MFAAKIFRMLSAHRSSQEFGLKMQDIHSGFTLQDKQEAEAGSAGIDEFSELDLPAEDTTIAGY